MVCLLDNRSLNVKRVTNAIIEWAYWSALKRIGGTENVQIGSIEAFLVLKYVNSPIPIYPNSDYDHYNLFSDEFVAAFKCLKINVINTLKIKRQDLLEEESLKGTMSSLL